MAPYNRRKLTIDLGTLLVVMVAIVLTVALVLTILHASGDGFLRKPASIAAGLADILGGNE